MTRPTWLLLLVLPACQGPEQGLDRTVLTGTVTIPPVAVEEIDRASENNDSPTSPNPIGDEGSTSLSYRAVKVTGTTEGWGLSAISGSPQAPDNFGFAPATEGTFTIWFNYETGGAGAKTGEANVYVVELIDPSAYDPDTGAGVYWSETTDGYDGAWSGSFEVAAGTTYTLQVYGLTSDTGAEVPYELIFSGSAVEDDTVLVGLYATDDPSVASNPLGGTTANGWVFEPTTLTWTGTYVALYARAVTLPADEDTADDVQPDPIIEENVASVWVRAATFGTLNDGLNAGTLYSSTSVAVSLTHAEQTVTEALVLDAIAPKVIGVQAVESKPDKTFGDVEITKDYSDYALDSSTVSAQDIGLLSGLGYVDTIDGAVDMSGGVAGWDKNDSDVFAFTVPEEMFARISLAWADPAADIDIVLVGPAKGYDLIDYAYAGCAYVNNPEVCETYISVVPKTTYYVVVLGYEGSDVEPYHVELEWLAP